MAGGSSRPRDPSADLASRLASVGVPETAWRRAGRRHLRSIARDLPLFDSAWVDACLADGLLTPLQADRLAGGGRLSVGPFGLLERLESDAGTDVLRGRHRGGAGAELMRLPREAADTSSPLRTELDAAAVLFPQAGRGLQWIRGVAVDDGQAWAVLESVPGESLARRLSIRGRTPPGEAATIGAGLLEALAAVHALGRVHSDLRLGTVRIDAGGRVTLLRCPVASVLRPEPSYEPNAPAEPCDGTSPERIEGRPADARSDLYAAGCLLWTLLAGRPPFPHGSALGKLRMHASRPVPPVTDYAPDTPTRLAALVEVLTDRDPAGRPESARDAARFVSGERTTVRVLPPRPRRTRPLRRVALATTAAAAAFAAAPSLMSLVTERPNAPALEASVASPQVWPKADAAGVIELPSGRWTPPLIESQRPVVVRGAATGGTVIDATGGWELYAESVTLEDVRLVVGREPVLVAAQDFSAARCRVRAAGDAFAWRPLDETDATGRRVAFERCVFEGGAAAVRLDGPARSVAATNVLCVATRSLVDFGDHWPRRPGRLDMSNCTLRQGRSLLRFDGDGADRGQQVRVRVTGSVLDLQSGVVMNAAETQRDEVGRRLVFSAAGSVAPDLLSLVPDGELVDVPSGRLAFAGNASGRPADSVLLDAGIPLPAGRWPGVRLGPPARTADGPSPAAAVTR